MQFIVISEQLRTALYALLFGAAAAGVYDGVRLFRSLTLAQGRGSVTFANILDVLYAVVLGCSYSVFLFAENNGRYRWYLLFSAVLGFVLYRLSLGRLVKRTVFRAAAFVRKAVQLLLKLLWRPFRALGKAVGKAFGKMSTAIVRRRQKKKQNAEMRRREKTAESGRKTFGEEGNRNGQSRKKRNKLYG